MKSYATLFILFATIFISKANTLDVYPAPEGVKFSERFIITVEQNGINYNSFVYLSTPLDNDADNAQSVREGVVKGINETKVLSKHYFGGKEMPLNTEQSVAWTCFSFSGEVSVKVTHKDLIDDVKILPSSLNIKPTIKGKQLSFKLNKPEKLAVVINGDYLNPLFLFADAPEQAIPDKSAPGTLVIHPNDDINTIKQNAKTASVLYFEPGVHHIGVAFEVYANQTIYMAGGSYLLGTIHGYMAPNVTIRGRGVLAGDSISRKAVYALKKEVGFSKRVVERMRYHAINMLSDQNDRSWNAFADYPGSGCDNLTIEGITIASPRQFFIRATGVPMTIYNVKMLGSWPYNTDGISTIGQAYTTVYDCFFNCNDDAIYVSPNYAHIHHCRFWQGNNGCVFQFGWGSAPYPQQGTYVHDCDILHMGHTEEANNRMVFGSRKGGAGDIGHVYFKNIHIEGPVWSLIRLETNGGGNLGSLHNITFENVHVSGPAVRKSTIISSKDKTADESSDSWVRDISFKNVSINGKPISEKDFIIGDFQVKNINFNK